MSCHHARMLQSVELLLDDAGEERIRADWRLLDEAGLASQAQHRSASNRPHVMLAAVTSLAPADEDRVAWACRDALPVRAYVGPLTVFGRDPVALVRLVVATVPLLHLHAVVAEAAGTVTDEPGAPGRWVPHVTLAHRLPRDQLGRALAALPRHEVPVRFEHARRFDPDRRRTWLVA